MSIKIKLFYKVNYEHNVNNSDTDGLLHIAARHNKKNTDIVKILLDAGANANYCKEETKMTALHWLSYNNDADAISVLLSKDADNLLFSHDNNLPIDVAGTTPSLQSIDVLLSHYAKTNNLNEQKNYVTRSNMVDKLII